MSEILGEEADIGICEFCGSTGLIDEGICCDGCNGSFFCRSICFRNHQNCSGLVTRDGQIVRIGDKLQYPSHYDIFTVIEMQGTWVKGGYARGLRHRGSHEMPIITRLMQHV